MIVVDYLALSVARVLIAPDSPSGQSTVAAFLSMITAAGLNR
jgi:hypothetical protein